MKKLILAVAAVFALASAPAFSKCKNCDDHTKQAHGKGHKPTKGEDCEQGKRKNRKAQKESEEKREPSSAPELIGDTAKLIYDRLPGAADKLADGGAGKEGDLVCYQKGESYLCAVRGEDEETGRFEGAAAKEVYEKIAPGAEYEDRLGTAKEAPVSCAFKAKAYACELQE